MTNDFLPADYDVPMSGGNYTKLKLGTNRLRILASPVLGWEWWTETKDNTGAVKRTPNRHHMADNRADYDGEEPKHFWAMPIWNYDTKHIELWEITQKGLMKTLRTLAQDVDWGSPTGYDIVVAKEGESLETKYALTPKPKTELADDVLEAYNASTVNLEALFTGEDPFAPVDEPKSPKQQLSAKAAKEAEDIEVGLNALDA